MARFLLMSALLVACADDRVASTRARLTGYETGPSEESWRAAGPEMAQSLRAIAADPAEKVVQRGRACEALGWVDASSGQFLIGILKDVSSAAIVRAGAVTGLARTGASADVLAQGFADPDATVRFRVVMELSKLGDPGQKAIRAHAPQETDDSVKRLLGERLRDPTPARPPLLVPGPQAIE